jgi:hypothetical protein
MLCVDQVRAIFQLGHWCLAVFSPYVPTYSLVHHFSKYTIRRCGILRMLDCLHLFNGSRVHFLARKLGSSFSFGKLLDSRDTYSNQLFFISEDLIWLIYTVQIRASSDDLNKPYTARTWSNYDTLEVLTPTTRVRNRFLSIFVSRERNIGSAS